MRAKSAEASKLKRCLADRLTEKLRAQNKDKRMNRILTIADRELAPEWDSTSLFANSKLVRDDLPCSANVAGTSRLPCVGPGLEKRCVASSGAPAGHSAPVQPATLNQP
jgi:hypothetical protein